MKRNVSSLSDVWINIVTLQCQLKCFFPTACDCLRKCVSQCHHGKICTLRVGNVIVILVFCRINACLYVFSRIFVNMMGVVRIKSKYYFESLQCIKMQRYLLHWICCVYRSAFGYQWQFRSVSSQQLHRWWLGIFVNHFLRGNELGSPINGVNQSKDVSKEDNLIEY